jgi:enoyl-CoA hydratase/carnithine racemase
MSVFEDYKDKYSNIAMRRIDGIIELRFHTEEGSLQWNLKPHAQLEQAFLDVGRDYDNQIVILTGTGREFCGPQLGLGGHPTRNTMTPQQFDPIYWESKRLLGNLLDIEMPVISAINGPAYRHAEIALLSDIVIASDDVEIQDSAHFQGGMVPGDGVHVVYPVLMGLNRARYFLLTGEVIGAAEALRLGLVNEVIPKDQVLDRAWELARLLLCQDSLVRRYSRVVLTEDLKRRMQSQLGYGLALQGIARMKRA